MSREPGRLPRPRVVIINTALQYNSEAGRTYPATVVGYDQTGDIALIQPQQAAGLTTVPTGNFSSVKVLKGVPAR